ncbi:MAG: DUF3089 domain-containing protein, partial [Acidimicrobiales bacterium]
YTPRPSPDYQQSDAWLIRPDEADNNTQGLGDVFVVGPTIYLGGRHWNAPIDDPRVQRNFKRIVLPNYVLPYVLAGRVYSPIYRQASLYSFLTNREDAQAAQEFAYRDVRRAFKLFLDESPPERPIIIVGHGQGGLHAQRLLGEFKESSLGQKLAAAYIIDHPLMQETQENNFPEFPPCADISDSGCVVAFSAFMPQESKRAQLFVGKTMVWDQGELKSVNGRPLICINPLLWNQSTDYAPQRLHLGGVAAEGLDAQTLPAPTAKQTGAQCLDGILSTDKPKQKSLRRPSRFGGKYRTPESNLFYEDLRVDAARRVQNKIDLNVLPRLAPTMDFETIEIEESPVTLPKKPVKR